MHLHFILIEQLRMMKVLKKGKERRKKREGKKQKEKANRKMQDCGKCVRQRDIEAAFKTVMRNISTVAHCQKRAQRNTEKGTKN